MSIYTNGGVLSLPDSPSPDDFLNAIRNIEADARAGADYFTPVNINGDDFLSVTISSEDESLVINIPAVPLEPGDIQDMADRLQDVWENAADDLEVEATDRSVFGADPGGPIDNNTSFGPYTEKDVLPISHNENFYFKDTVVKFEAGERKGLPAFLKGEQIGPEAGIVAADRDKRTPGIWQRHGFDQLKGDVFTLTPDKHSLTVENTLVSKDSSGQTEPSFVKEMEDRYDKATIRVDRLSGMDGYVPDLKDDHGKVVTDKNGSPIKAVSMYVISAVEKDTGERVYERVYAAPDGEVLGLDNPEKTSFHVYPGEKLDIADRTNSLAGKGRPFGKIESMEDSIDRASEEYLGRLKAEVGKKVEMAKKEKAGMEACRDKLAGFIDMAKTVKALEMSDPFEINGEKVSLIDLYEKIGSSLDAGKAISERIRAGESSPISTEDKAFLKDIFNYISLSVRPTMYGSFIEQASSVHGQFDGAVKVNGYQEQRFDQIDVVSDKINSLFDIDMQTRVGLESAMDAYRDVMDTFGGGILSEDDVIAQTGDYIKERVDDYNKDKDEEHKLHVTEDDRGNVRVYTYGGNLLTPEGASATVYDDKEDFRADRTGKDADDHRLILLEDACKGFFRGAADISTNPKDVISMAIPYRTIVDGIYQIKTGEMRADYLTSEQKEELRGKVEAYIKDQYGIKADRDVVSEVMRSDDHPVVKEYLGSLDTPPMDIERLEGLSYEDLKTASEGGKVDKDDPRVDLNVPTSKDVNAVKEDQPVVDYPKSYGRYGRVNYHRDVALSDRCQYDIKVEARQTAQVGDKDYISAKEDMNAHRDAYRGMAVQSFADEYKEKAEELYKANSEKYDGEAIVRTEAYYARHHDDLETQFAKAAGEDGDVDKYRDEWKKQAFESFKEDKIAEIMTDLSREDDNAVRVEARGIAVSSNDYKDTVRTPELEAEARSEARQWARDNKDELTKEAKNELAGKDFGSDAFDKRAREELPGADESAIKDRADQLRIQDRIDQKAEAKFKEIYEEKVIDKASEKIAASLREQKVEKRTDEIIEKRALEKSIEKKEEKLTKEKKAELNRYKVAIMAIDRRLERYESWPYRALTKNGNYNYNVYAKTMLIKGYLEAGGRDDMKFFKDHIGDPNVDPKAKSFLEKGVSRFEVAAAWKSAYIESRFFETAISEKMYDYSEKHPYEYKLQHGTEESFDAYKKLNGYRESSAFKEVFSYNSFGNSVKLVGANAVCIAAAVAITGGLLANPIAAVLVFSAIGRGSIAINRKIDQAKAGKIIKDMLDGHPVDTIAGIPVEKGPADKPDSPDGGSKTDNEDEEERRRLARQQAGGGGGSGVSSGSTADDGKGAGDTTDDGKKPDSPTNEGKKPDGATGDNKKDDGATNDSKKSDDVTGDGKETDSATDDGKKPDDVAEDGKKPNDVAGDDKKADGPTDDGRKPDDVAEDGKKTDSAADDEKKADGAVDDDKGPEDVSDDSKQDDTADDGKKDGGIDKGDTASEDKVTGEGKSEDPVNSEEEASDQVAKEEEADKEAAILEASADPQIDVSAEGNEDPKDSVSDDDKAPEKAAADQDEEGKVTGPDETGDKAAADDDGKPAADDDQEGRLSQPDEDPQEARVDQDPAGEDATPEPDPAVQEELEAAPDPAADNEEDNTSAPDTADAGEDAAAVEGQNVSSQAPDVDEDAHAVSQDGQEDDNTTVPESEGSGDNVSSEGEAVRKMANDDDSDGDDAEDAVAVSAGSQKEPDESEQENAVDQKPVEEKPVDTGSAESPGIEKEGEIHDQRQDAERSTNVVPESDIESGAVNDNILEDAIADRLQAVLAGTEEMDHVMKGSGSQTGLEQAAEDAAVDVVNFAEKAGELIGNAISDVTAPETYENAVSAAAYLDDFFQKFDDDDNKSSDKGPSDAFRNAVERGLSGESSVTFDDFMNDMETVRDSMSESVVNMGSIAGVEFEVADTAVDAMDVTEEDIVHTSTDEQATGSPMDMLMDFFHEAMEALGNLIGIFSSATDDAFGDIINDEIERDPITEDQAMMSTEQNVDTGMDTSDMEKFQMPDFDEEEQFRRSQQAGSDVTGTDQGFEIDTGAAAEEADAMMAVLF